MYTCICTCVHVCVGESVLAYRSMYYNLPHEAASYFCLLSSGMSVKSMITYFLRLCLSPVVQKPLFSFFSLFINLCSVYIQGTVSVGVNATDLFDDYGQDDDYYG